MSATVETTSRAQPASRSSSGEIGLWNRCAFQTVRVVLWLFANALGLGGLYRLGRLFGTLEWCVNYKRRRVVRERLRRVLGESFAPADGRRHARAHFQIMRCDKIFYLVMDMLPRDAVLRRFHIDGRDLLDAALDRGRGVYVALSHQVAHHVAGLCLALSGYRVAGVRDRKEGAVRRFIQHKYEARYPEFRSIRMMFADAYPRDIYRCLAANYVLGSALDVHRPRETHQKTAAVRVFGEQRRFLTGTLQIALRSGSIVLQGLILSEPGFHYRLKLIGPLTGPEQSRDTPELLSKVMQTYADNVETFARRHPSHVTRV